MKKYLIPIYLFAILLCGSNVYGQDGNIELGVTYDQSFEDLVGKDNVNEKIDDLCMVAQMVAFNSGVIMSLSPSIKKANIPVLGISQNEILKRVSGLWIHSNSCYYPDVIIHLTHKQIEGGGGFTAGNSCYSPANVGLAAGAIAKIAPAFEAGRLNFAHEVFHNILNKGHLPASYCTGSTIYLMCDGGPTVGEQEWRLTSEEVTYLNNKLLDPTSCYYIKNIPLVQTCFNCDNNIKAVPGGTIHRPEVISMACDNNKEIILESTIYNSCQVEERLMNVELQYRDNEIEILEINEDFEGPFPIQANSPRDPNMKYIFNKILIKDEIYSAMAKIKVIGGTIRNGNYNAPAIFHYVFDPSSSTIVTDQYNIFYPRVNLDLSNEAIVGTGMINQAYINSTGALRLCPGIIPIDIQLNGTLNIHHETFCNTDFYMGPNASVNITGNATFNNCNFITCNGARWNGINVINNAKVVMNDCTIKNATKGIIADVARAKLTLNNTFIQSGGTGLEIFNSNDYGAYTGYVHITGCDISENDRYGIHVKDLLLQNVLKTKINGNLKGIFSENTSLNINLCHLEGNAIAIDQDAVGDFMNVQQTDFENNDRYDISADNSHVYIDNNCTFEGAIVGVYLKNSIGTNYKILNSNFNNTAFSIFGTNNIPFNFSELRNNVIENYIYGFRSSDIAGVSLNGWEIEGNSFSSSKARSAIRTSGGNFYSIQNNTILHGSSRPGSASDQISIEGNLANNVACNLLIGPDGLREDDNARGIFMAGGYANTLSCNNISGSSFNINVSGMSNGATIRGNTLSGSANGLLYGLWPSNGDAFTGEQTHKGNIFENGTFSSGFGARHLSNLQFNVDQSRYTVNSTANPLFFTEANAVGNFVQDFPSSIDNNSFICSSSSCPIGIGSTFGGGNNPSDLDIAMMASTLSGTSSSSSLISSGQYYLYQDVNSLIDGGSSSIHQAYRDFQFSKSTTPLSNFVSLSDELALHVSSFEDLSISSEQIWNAITTLDFNDVDEATYIQDVEDIKELILQYKLTYLSKYEDFSDLTDIALSSLSNVQSEEVPLSNRISVMISQLKIQKGLPFDTLGMVALANQCPIEGGDAVYYARGLMEVYHGISDYDDAVLCQNTDTRSTSNSSEHHVTVYPNPSTDKVAITANTLIDKVTIFDKTGLQINQVMVNKTTITLNTSALDSGVYFAKVHMADGSTTTKKLILIK